jgi:hypothetical protein
MELTFDELHPKSTDKRRIARHDWLRIKNNSHPCLNTPIKSSLTVWSPIYAEACPDMDGCSMNPSARAIYDFICLRWTTASSIPCSSRNSLR